MEIHESRINNRYSIHLVEKWLELTPNRLKFPIFVLNPSSDCGIIKLPTPIMFFFEKRYVSKLANIPLLLS